MKLYLTEPLDIKMFTHVKETKTFVCDHSDLLRYPIFQKIYNDAMDIGFQVKNPKSNQTILVLFSKELLGPEDELVGAEFLPSDADVEKFPSLKNYKFVIYND